MHDYSIIEAIGSFMGLGAVFCILKTLWGMQAGVSSWICVGYVAGAVVLVFVSLVVMQAGD